MGLLDLFRPSPARRLARAQAHLQAGRWADARLDALDAGTEPGADLVVTAAERELLRTNLDAARSWAEAGDAERVAAHLELAAGFARSADDRDALTAARADVRAIGAAHEARATHRARAEDADLASVDPRFREAVGGVAIPLPPDLSDDEAEAVEARLAMLLEGYPDAHRDAAVALGAEFLRAVLLLDDGEADAALPLLATFDDDVAILHHERARAAMALGDPAAAARAWRRFAERHGSHDVISDIPTHVALSEALAAAGDHDTALREVMAARRAHPKHAGLLHAALLERAGRPADAEAILREQLTLHGPQPAIYLAVAGLRLRGGKRTEAMAALETSLHQSSCATGSCGPRGPDLPTQRLLATLYLEDGVDTGRGLELADAAAAQVRQPGWDDVYLKVLADRARAQPGWTDLVDRLRQTLPDRDPRHARLDALA